MKNYIIIILALLLNLQTHFVFAQKTQNADSLFTLAQNYAFNKNTEEARRICFKILKSRSNYIDARILIGRTYAWDKNYKLARLELEKVHKADSTNFEAISALSDCELWDNEYSKSIKYINLGLKLDTNNIDLLFKKEQVYELTNDIELSIITIKTILQLEPENQKAEEILNRLLRLNKHNVIKIDHTFNYFEQPYLRRWHITSLSYARKENKGSVIGRVNAGDLILDSETFHQQVALQYEVDIYPKLGNKTYLYINLGFSQSNLFPNHKGALELFKGLSKGFDASIGGRYLYFDSSLLVFTGSIGKYYKNFWFGFRPYIVPYSYGISQSFNFITKLHIDGSEEFVTLLLGYGNSPDETMLFYNGTSDLDMLNSKKIILLYQKPIKASWIISGFVEFKNEEYTTGNKRNSTKLNLGISYKF